MPGHFVHTTNAPSIPAFKDDYRHTGDQDHFSHLIVES